MVTTYDHPPVHVSIVSISIFSLGLVEVRLPSLSFPISSFLLFPKTGVALAVSQPSGTTPS